MLPGDSTAHRKARGAFYTPPAVARFIVEWAVRCADDSVLEPSCGEAVFLHACADVDGFRGTLKGIELHRDSARHAQRQLRAAGVRASVETADFFLREPSAQYDAVVGNPPYVRYQSFTGEARRRSRAAALRAGVNLTGLASSWAAFVIHSALHLRDGGRLGLVLPAELLTVNYAAAVRRFLMDHFSSVGLVLFSERVFAGVQEEVVLLLADGFRSDGGDGTDHCEVYQLADAADLATVSIAGHGQPQRWVPASKSAKWSGSMLSTSGASAFETITGTTSFATLADWGRTKLGMVTGNNTFFALSPERVVELGLVDSDVIALSPPGSRHLRGLTLTGANLAALGAQGQATWLFRPDGPPSPAARRYIAAGEATGVNTAYKCRVRDPWWRVPHLAPPDLFLTYMNADTPRLCTNRHRVHHLNSVHGVYADAGVRRDAMDLLPLASLNSVTLLGAETIGRAYGGGLLKVEPSEAAQLPMPAPELVAAHRRELSSVRTEVRRALRSRALTDAVAIVDAVLLTDALNLDSDALDALRADQRHLSGRRAARSKGI
ncbi:SAM-dependent DNA methyltransferase [Gordonia sp. TBRC 11910]|uniref:SAM-dependent DNA methyltransferase n=1 Tax=Gordonia asplenii TaxID=2725283 RepID=A0A848L870_9ACTN|nr:N-6 DNA methylase [Gordonia asplenii]NMO04953.1 SAM-dependent DNA methyltransferase [Gordonia asplenii]